MGSDDSDPDDFLIGRGGWRLWLGLVLVVALPYLALCWFLIR